MEKDEAKHDGVLIEDTPENRKKVQEGMEMLNRMVPFLKKWHDENIENDKLWEKGELK